MPTKLKYARVLVDIPLLHLDRCFDYSIPAELTDSAVVGARVRVKFSGRKLLGYVREIVDQVERPERVAPLLEVLGPSVVTEAQFDLTRLVADRWVGAQSDVLTSAIPPRHVRAEKSVMSSLPTPHQTLPALATNNRERWQRYLGGAELLNRLQSQPIQTRAALLAAPGDSLASLAMDCAQACNAPTLILAPDLRLLNQLEAEIQQRAEAQTWLVLTSDLSPAQRYENYLRVLRGEVQVVLGTRSAVFAPLPELKLIIVIDDGDDSFQEQSAPGWHAREVSILRSTSENCGWIGIANSRSCETQNFVTQNWCVSIAPERDWYRHQCPAVRAVNDAELARDPIARSARLPAMIFETIRTGLQVGPVLLQVPRRGYQLHLLCDSCRQPAKCSQCSGPLERAQANASPSCSWCGSMHNQFSCSWCGGRSLRSYQIGSVRTAEEIGRAFPEVSLIRSGRDNVVIEIPNRPALVIATPGAEPSVSDGFYAAAAILDADSTLARADLRTEEESMRRWMNLSALVSPRTGKIAIAGDDGQLVIQALVRHDPIGLAERINSDRESAQFPPITGLAELIYPTTTEVIAQLNLPHEVSIWGPVSRSDGSARVLLSYPRSLSALVASELRALLAKRAADKEEGRFALRIDPAVIR